MKKVLFGSVLFISMFQVSCSDDDNSEESEGVVENNAPNEVVLSIEQESGLSIDLAWDEVTDEDGDAVTYDLYANNEIVEADLTSVGYSWTAEGLDDVSYPVIFTVVSKDENGGESTSNEVELDDPIIGTWIKILSAHRLIDGSFGEFENVKEIGLCNDTDDSFIFSGNEFIFEIFDIDSSDDIGCFSVVVPGTWENIGSQNYSFMTTDEDANSSLFEIFFVFEGNTFNYESSDSSFIYERQ